MSQITSNVTQENDRGRQGGGNILRGDNPDPIGSWRTTNINGLQCVQVGFKAACYGFGQLKHGLTASQASQMLLDTYDQLYSAADDPASAALRHQVRTTAGATSCGITLFLELPVLELPVSDHPRPITDLTLQEKALTAAIFAGKFVENVEAHIAPLVARDAQREADWNAQQAQVPASMGPSRGWRYVPSFLRRRI